MALLQLADVGNMHRLCAKHAPPALLTLTLTTLRQIQNDKFAQMHLVQLEYQQPCWCLLNKTTVW